MMDSDFSQFMYDLPQPVTNMNDAARLLTKYGNTPFLYKKNMQRAINAMKPGERLYFIVIASYIKIKDKNGKKIADTTGIACLSDQRFFCELNSAEIVEFPVDEIHSIASSKMKGDFYSIVSFSTTTTNVEIKSNAKVEPYSSILQEVLLHVVSNAPVSSLDNEPKNGAKAEDEIKKVAKCANCGASIIVFPNLINKCDYCGRLVEVSSDVPPAPATVPSGDRFCPNCRKMAESSFCPNCGTKTV